MQSVRRTAIRILILLGFIAPGLARADLTFHGGPVLKSFHVIPYYYGPWTQSDINAHQNYLVGLTQYISGANAPTNAVPMLTQYGVTSADVAPPVVKTSVATPIVLNTAQALDVIHQAQATGALPPYANDRIILLMLPSGATLTVHCGYHGAEGIGKYYAFVTQDCGPWLQVTAHELFETAANPAGDAGEPGWDELVDPCGTSFSLWFGPVPGVYDNSIHACSATGYDAMPTQIAPGLFTAVWRQSGQPEIQATACPYAAYRQRYDELWNVGWRLHILQPYVANGAVLYNAVWRPGREGEIQVYGWNYDDYRAKYDQLWTQGWRLKLLQPYVINGQVLYTAVWKQGNESEIQVYGCKYQDLRAKYDNLWNQGWRLKLLQPYVLNGQVLYTAAWKRSTEGEIQVYGWKYDEFRAKYDRLWNQGWRLKLIQPFLLNGQVLYSAAWHRATNGEVQVYGWNNHDYRAKYDEMAATGWRPQILAAY